MTSELHDLMLFVEALIEDLEEEVGRGPVEYADRPRMANGIDGFASRLSAAADELRRRA